MPSSNEVWNAVSSNVDSAIETKINAALGDDGTIKRTINDALKGVITDLELEYLKETKRLVIRQTKKDAPESVDSVAISD